MQSLVFSLLCLSVLSLLVALPQPRSGSLAATCQSYTLINTRGTLEPQGESAGFKTMNARITSQLPGGKIYNTVYPADLLQNTIPGTEDIVRQINDTLQTSPAECFILQGYSQGAAATADALPRLTGVLSDAVKGVFLIGDPWHKSGLACNVDNNGGDTTRYFNGQASWQRGIPQDWVSKTLDVCMYGDDVCDTTPGHAVFARHLAYPTDVPTQNLGTSFAMQRLGAAGK